MASLLLMRHRPLSNDEIRRLPPECSVVTDSSLVVARADVELPLSIMVKLAVAMGRAVPDASFAFHEVTAKGFSPIRRNTDIPAQRWKQEEVEELSYEEMEDSEEKEDSEEMEDSEEQERSESIEEAQELSYEEISSEEVEVEQSWWELLEDQQVEESMALLADRTLSMEDRGRLRNYLQSKEDWKVAFVCRAARECNWRSFVVALRKSFTHSSAKVRMEAVTSIGVLAGPSMSPAVHLLLSDPDGKVRAAARKAYQKMRR